jgi:hypothetical protein
MEINEKIYKKVLPKLKFMLLMTEEGIKSSNTGFAQRQALKIEKKSLTKLIKQFEYVGD